jgi:hypothetical protein
MPLMRSLTPICAIMFALSGCSLTPPVEQAGPLFCDVEEARRFSQEEIDWRAEHALWNLRRDFKTNATWDRECVGGEDD